jgi:hypothetical protein
MESFEAVENKAWPASASALEQASSGEDEIDVGN